MDEIAGGKVLHFAGVTLDGARACLRGLDGTEVGLAPKPFDLLMVLARNAGRTMSKGALLDAIWPGVHVTEDSLFQAVREARRAIGDEAGLVLRSVPRRGYLLDVAVTADAAPDAAHTAGPAPLAPPNDRPSLVVLPFQNMSGDPEQDYFADGMVEDITMALSRTRWLFVIARNSAFAYKASSVDVREVGRELGVRYVLQGSVRRSGGQIRIGCQLVEAESREQVWAERFDGDLADVFVLQDRLMEAVAGAIEPSLRIAEMTRARRKPVLSLDAYDLYLRAHALVDAFTRDAVTEMLALCEQAVELDPGLTRAWALGARAYIQLYVQGWRDRNDAERSRAMVWAERGLVTGPQDALMLAEAGQLFAWWGGQLDRGIALLDEAIAANPYLVEPLLKSGVVRTRAGQTALAKEHSLRALRLSPRDTRRYAIFEALAVAHLLERDLDEAHAWALRAVRHNPNYLAGWRSLAAIAGHLGRTEEARMGVDRIHAIWPTFSVSLYRELFPVSACDKWEFVFDGLRRAGLPD
jgi:TolB-like protein/Tfp pilus assembly protein PilF